MEDEKIKAFKEGILMTSQNPKKANGTVKINSTLHTFIVYQLGRKGISQTLLAKICGCTPVFINYIITGRRKSYEIQTRIAHFLGFRNWDHLYYEALRFDEKVNALYFVLKEMDGENIG